MKILALYALTSSSIPTTPLPAPLCFYMHQNTDVPDIALAAREISKIAETLRCQALSAPVRLCSAVVYLSFLIMKEKLHYRYYYIGFTYIHLLMYVRCIMPENSIKSDFACCLFYEVFLQATERLVLFLFITSKIVYSYRPDELYSTGEEQLWVSEILPALDPEWCSRKSCQRPLTAPDLARVILHHRLVALPPTGSLLVVIFVACSESCFPIPITE